MKKSTISNIRKKRVGRPPVNAVPVMVRIPPAELEPIDAWAAKQAVSVTRPEAIRRLVEIGLAGSTTRPARRPDLNAAKAKVLASKIIDGLIDPSAPAEEKAIRKRRLVKGPSEFRDVRIDRAKTEPK
jgi:hypothetical protein